MRGWFGGFGEHWCRLCGGGISPPLQELLQLVSSLFGDGASWWVAGTESVSAMRPLSGEEEQQRGKEPWKGREIRMWPRAAASFLLLIEIEKGKKPSGYTYKTGEKLGVTDPGGREPRV